MVTVLSPLTWGIYSKPPPDIPECGFIGELCPPPIRGKSPCSSCDIASVLMLIANSLKCPFLNASRTRKHPKECIPLSSRHLEVCLNSYFMTELILLIPSNSPNLMEIS